MFADMLTKGLYRDQFVKLREMAGVKELQHTPPVSEKECLRSPLLAYYMHMYTMIDYRHLCGCLWCKCVFDYCFVSNSV